MKSFRVLAMVAAMSMASAAYGQAAPASGDEAAIRAVFAHELEGWSKFDPAVIGSCFTVDTTWQNPFGVRVHSRADLEKFLGRLFQRPGYRSAKETMMPRITDIHILSPTTAVVWSEQKSEGQIDDATGKAMAPRYSHYVEVMTKTAGGWLVADSMIMDEYPRP